VTQLLVILGGVGVIETPLFLYGLGLFMLMITWKSSFLFFELGVGFSYPIPFLLPLVPLQFLSFSTFFFILRRLLFITFRFLFNLFTFCPYILRIMFIFFFLNFPKLVTGYEILPDVIFLPKLLQN
jgi:hypothetical protein